MKHLAMGILCPLVLVLTACGGGGSSDKPKNNSSAPASVAMSSAASEASSESSAMESASSTSMPAESSSSLPNEGSSSAESASSTNMSAESSSVLGGGGVSSSAESMSSAVSLTSSSSSNSSAITSVSSSSVNSSISSSSNSSTSSSSASVVAQTGVFIDSAVAGINYETSPGNFSGVTSATGQYQYAEGDTVIFSIGAITLPSVTAKGVVTPLDMGTDASDQVVINIAVLLQSLDSDGDASNGITIPTTAAAAATSAVSFDQPYASFAADSDVLTLVQHSNSNKLVVTESAAIAHMEESLAQVNAQSLVGTWYVEGEDYRYALFILDATHYASVDYDFSGDEGSGAALATGSYEWNQETGVVTISDMERTDSDLDARPPMADGNTFVLNGNTLTVNDDGTVDGEAVEFVLHRLVSTSEHPMIGGWMIDNEEAFVVFAFTGTHYLMGQKSEEEEDGSGQSGAEIGTYEYDLETNAVMVTTIADTNGEWGFSHNCALLNDGSNPEYQQTNYLACGPGGRNIVETLKVTGDTLTFVTEADTIANGGEEEPVEFERINGLPDGDIHLKLEVTLELIEYVHGERFEPENATMQCNIDGAPELGEVEVWNESWVLGGNPDRPTWVAAISATYNPETKAISFDLHEPVGPVPNNPGFYQEFFETFEGAYNPGETNVITGTYIETSHLTWDRSADVSTCISTYSVTGVLR